MTNPYKVLGVSNGADLPTCKKAYRMLCKKYHPDNYNGDTSKFDEISKAYKSIESGKSPTFIHKTVTKVIHKNLHEFVVSV